MGESAAALRAAVFSLSSKKLRGGGGGGVQTPPPPTGRGLKGVCLLYLSSENIFHVLTRALVGSFYNAIWWGGGYF